jgi:ribosomal protein S11
MAAIENLQQDIDVLKNNYTALSTLLTTKVAPNIETAVALIKAGNNNAALEALDEAVKAINAQVVGDTGTVQAAETDLEGAEA